MQNYIDKLRTRPENERRKIAVIATGISFVIIFFIWAASFSEMNRDSEKASEESASSAVDQMEEMKNQLQSDSLSIEEMMESMPEEELGMEEEIGAGDETVDGEPGEENSSEIQDNAAENQDIQENEQIEVPQLP